jgi:dTDP-4-dehydrorhamnose 3,5-epimerase
MEQRSTSIDGCMVLALEPHVDERGFFARAFDAEKLAEAGMITEVAQINMAHSRRMGTIRGIHWQRAPHAEAKFVRCVRGSVFDVCVDVRAGSATSGRWFGVELSTENNLALYVPPGCGHVNQSLAPDTTILYTVSVPYAPETEMGARWDDRAFAIDWPVTENVIVSAKDRAWPDWEGPVLPATADDTVPL